MEAVDVEAAKVGHNTSMIQEIRRLLQLPEQEFVKLQLKKAVELNDPARKIHREIRLKDLYMEQFKSLFEFTRFSKLRDPYEYACIGFFSFLKDKDAVAAGMLRWSKTPIHASLCELSPELSSDACRIHKTILGYCGDRTYQGSPEALAAEILQVRRSLVVLGRIFCTSSDQWSGCPLSPL